MLRKTSIATAKGFAKVHGPWLRACTCCGRYYDEHAYDEHVRFCRPPPKSKKVKCHKCGKEVDSERIRTHMRYYATTIPALVGPICLRRALPCDVAIVAVRSSCED
jgi:NAD-dependent SIR2 family protein deacetylase